VVAHWRIEPFEGKGGAGSFTDFLGSLIELDFHHAAIAVGSVDLEGYWLALGKFRIGGRACNDHLRILIRVSYYSYGYGCRRKRGVVIVSHLYRQFMSARGR